MSNSRQIEVRGAFPSREDTLLSLLEGNHLNPRARANVLKELGILGIALTVEVDQKEPDTKLLGGLKTNGVPIPGPAPVEKP